MRRIEALNLPDVIVAPIATASPRLELAGVDRLCVDERYQRNLSERSLRLIRKIVAAWDWRAFKPPVVVQGDSGLEVIDGQHTAIAAVTRGDIPQLPVLIVEAADIADRARSFVSHNRDRIQVTPTQLHTALAAAGDESALTLNQVCDRAGARIIKALPPNGRYEVGDIVAVTTLRALVNRRHALGARKVLEVCVKGGAAPISAGLMRAVEHLLHAEEYRGEIDGERIALVLSAMRSTLDAEAERFATERKTPLWRGLASVIFMNRRKRNAA